MPKSRSRKFFEGLLQPIKGTDVLSQNINTRRQLEAVDRGEATTSGPHKGVGGEVPAKKKRR